MTTLGVTGGIGSGKSTVCRMLDVLGARVFYADPVAKRLMQEDDELRRKIVEAFGEEAYDEDGALNREHLASVVFADSDRLAELNALVHPRVFEAFGRVKKEAARDGVELLVHEAALIFESGGDAHLDVVAVVDAPEDVRIQRVMQRDGVDEAAVRARMQYQMPAEEKRRRADVVIRNDGTEEELRLQVEALYLKLTTC